MRSIQLFKLDAKKGDKSLRIHIVEDGTKITFSVTYGNEVEITDVEIRKGCPTKNTCYDLAGLFRKIVIDNKLDEVKAGKLIGELDDIWDQIKEITESIKKLQAFLNRQPVLAAPPPPQLP